MASIELTIEMIDLIDFWGCAHQESGEDCARCSKRKLCTETGVSLNREYRRLKELEEKQND